MQNVESFNTWNYHVEGYIFIDEVGGSSVEVSVQIQHERLNGSLPGRLDEVPVKVRGEVPTRMVPTQPESLQLQNNISLY